MEVPEGVLAPKAAQCHTSPSMIRRRSGWRINPRAAFPDRHPGRKKATSRSRMFTQGPYQIFPGASPPQYYLDSIRIGGHDALASGV